MKDITFNQLEVVVLLATEVPIVTVFFEEISPLGTSVMLHIWPSEGPPLPQEIVKASMWKTWTALPEGKKKAAFWNSFF